MTVRQDVNRMVGAIKGLKGWSDEDLSRVLKCSRGTIANLKSDPMRVRYEYVVRLEKLYRKECEA